MRSVVLSSTEADYITLSEMVKELKLVIQHMKVTEVFHIAHLWGSYGRCAMLGLPMG